MKKITLLIASMFLIMEAMAQSEINLSFTKNSETEATVTVNGNNINIGESSGTITSNYNWKTLTANSATFPTATILCPDKNTKEMKNGAEGTITITLNNLPNNYLFKEIKFTSVALNGSGAFQGDNANAQHVDFTLSKDGEEIAKIENKAIKVNSNGGATVELSFVPESAILATDGSIEFTLKITNNYDDKGCFYGLTKVTLVESLKVFKVNDTPLTYDVLMSKTGPTYIVMKNLSNTNNNWFTGGTSSATLNNEAIFVWEPTAEGKFYLKKMSNGQYLQSASCSLGAIETAATFTAVCPAGSFNGDSQANPFITDINDANMVRFVNNSGTWINVQGAASNPIYNSGQGSWTIQYVYELTEVYTYDVQITDTKWATFFAPGECIAPEEVTVYYAIADNVEEECIKLTKIENRIIPANTAVILYSKSAGTYTFNASNTNATIENNILKGTPISTNINEEAYVLGDKDGVGLYKAQTTDVVVNNSNVKIFKNNANKAYLPLASIPTTAQQTIGLRIEFDDGHTTAIECVERIYDKEEIYDLQGRRVNEITKAGIYIVNGKKLLVK